MTLRTTGLAGLAIALILAACGGGDDAKPTATFAPRVGFSQEDANVAAEQALLRLEDFPTGWTARLAGDDEGPDLDLPAECQDPDDPARVATVDSVVFHGLEVEEAESRVTVYTDENTARGAFTGANAYSEECLELLGQAFVKEILGKDAAPVEVNVDRLSFPSYGDETIARRVTVTVSLDELPFDVDLFLDVIGVRVAGLVGDLSFSTFRDRPDTDMEEGLMSITEDRLESAVSSLE